MNYIDNLLDIYQSISENQEYRIDVDAHSSENYNITFMLKNNTNNFGIHQPSKLSELELEFLREKAYREKNPLVINFISTTKELVEKGVQEKSFRENYFYIYGKKYRF